MNFKKIVKLFKRSSVCVFGLRGRGKDLLISNVVARRKEPYISNVPYGFERFELDFSKLDAGCNSYENFMDGDLSYYEFPYKPGTDIYISDVGVYLPSQYNKELNQRYKYFPTFLALSRQLGDCNVHINTQSLGRCWDKLREQSDTYIRCRWCKVLFHKIVIQAITIYEKCDSALNNVPQYPKKLFKGVGTRREIYEQQERTYLINYGKVKNRMLLYRHRGDYDTCYFKEILKNGKKQEIKDC